MLNNYSDDDTLCSASPKLHTERMPRLALILNPCTFTLKVLRIQMSHMHYNATAFQNMPTDTRY